MLEKKFIKMSGYQFGFVKKLVSLREYDNWYSTNYIYHKLYQDPSGVTIAFFASTPAADSYPLTLEEKVALHEYRKMNNISPSVLDDDYYVDNGILVKREKNTYIAGLEKLGNWIEQYFRKKVRVIKNI